MWTQHAADSILAYEARKPKALAIMLHSARIVLDFFPNLRHTQHMACTNSLATVTPPRAEVTCMLAWQVEARFFKMLHARLCSMAPIPQSQLHLDWQVP